MSGKSEEYQGSPFRNKNTRELSMKFGPFCSFREISGETEPFH